MRPTICALVIATWATACHRGNDHADDAADGDASGSDGGTASGSDGGVPEGCAAESLLDPGPMYLRRLTHREYAATIVDVVAADPDQAQALVATFPQDVVTSSFDNDGLHQSISVLLGERYLDAAEQLADAVLADATRRDRVIGCDPAAGEACLRDFVTRFGRRAMRRPLDDEEIDALVELALGQAEPDAQASIVIETVLMSPRFLFKVELGTPDPDHPERAKLGGFEVATRLSYLLWGTTPDDVLLDAAAAGQLDDADGVATMAEAMLDDGRVQTAMAQFGAQWFRLDDIAGQARDAASFPEFDAALQQAMVDELQALLQRHMFGDGEDFLDLYRTRSTAVNDALAAIYGVTPPGSSTLVPIELPEDGERGGLFTTAAFATASSRADETSPVQRAVYVRKLALCDPPPPPPPGVPQVQPEDGESTQDAFERHIDQGDSCAGCHLQLDPIGFGLERFDSIGRLRDSYGSGDPVKRDGTITIDGTEHAFSGGVELGALVADSQAAQGCVVTHAWRFALGRSEDPADECNREQVRLRFADAGNDFRSLLLALVRSDAFRYRRIEP
ncbi:MAG: DUF1592 domain-containing protein [Nannocystaceae bacterium]